MSTDPTQADRDALKAQARALLPILRVQARRPYIVELAGTPKAGKTTALHVLHRFLKDCGYHVQEMRERAGDCPIAMKGHFFFNTWTTTTMLASMIESLESEADVLLLDRGVFDAIVWLESQRLENQVSKDEYRVFRDFVLLNRWRSLTDSTFVFTVSPEKALERENKDLIVPRSGSIMGPEFLERYNAILAAVHDDVKEQFSIIKIDTTEHESPRATTYEIAKALIDRMERWANPDIAVLPRTIVASLFERQRIRQISDIIRDVQDSLEYRPRSTLVEGCDFVGIVAASVLQHCNEMLLFERSEERDEKRKLFGRHTLWKGCHVPRADDDSRDIVKLAANAVEARIKEDLHLAQLDSQLQPRCLVWNPDDRRDSLHVGLFFDLNIQEEAVALALAGKVFKRERNRTKLGGNKFISARALLERMQSKDSKEHVELESWSKIVLEQMTTGK